MTTEQIILAAIQKELNAEAALHNPPEALYRPSPGQTLDHVHHRIARIATNAIIATYPNIGKQDGMDPNRGTPSTS